jgi:hypothetical protein
MIAPQRIVEAPRVDRPRKPVRRRARRARRVVHAPGVVVIALVVALLVPLLAYVTLTANLTSLSYAIAREDRERAALVDETQRYDDRIARLESPERLASLAAQLKMHDPHVYAVIALPKPKVEHQQSGFAFLGWLKP